ncbi:MAG: DUF3307 domain-containing protein [Caldilineaceae bacterium]|nr:DUF3307 domain-containing protein [Caldilineaceae bacterium]
MALELLVLHWLGDFALQSDHMAAHKLSSARVRALHVVIYTLPFIAWLAITGQPWPTVTTLALFIAITHFIIDSQLFTLGSRWAHKPLVLDQGLHLIVLVIIQHVLGG